MGCLFFAAWVAASSLVAATASATLPWSSEARRAGLPVAFGIAVAPFMLGILVILAMWLLGGYSQTAHSLFVAGAVLACGVAVWPRWRRRNRTSHRRWINTGIWLWPLLVAAAYVAFVAFRSPFSANDPLEYATVGRVLFESRTLASYPVLSAETNFAGFFGPWTHPPLYVALLYFANVIGGTEADSVAKLFSPWFTLSSMVLVVAMGRFKDETTAFAAAAIYLATPLLLSGAVSAHIDPLAAAGFAVALAAIIGFRARPIASGIVQGVAIGLAMWTHSQAVLLLPVMLFAIVAYEGWADWRRLIVQCASVVFAAGVVASWPYLRNYEIYGSFISDNHAIYALKNLGWDQYFRSSRGYQYWPDRVQFGILKAWNTASYGIGYWLMPIGIVVFVSRALSRVPRSTLLKGFMDRVPDRWLLAPLGAVLCYFAGVLLSTLAGIDLMIRNDRYQIITAPAAALFAGYVVSVAIDRIRASIFRRRLWGRSLSAFMLVAALLVVGIASTRLPTQAETISGIVRSNSAEFPHRLEVARTLRDYVPKGELVLSMRPSDMYYADRKMVSYLDPRLVSFYNEPDTDRAHKMLRALGIEYVYMPNYFMPPVYNSRLKDIIADRRFSEIAVATPNARLYRLVDSPDSGQGPALSFGGEGNCWTVALNTTGAKGKVYCGSERSVVAPRSIFNQRLQKATLVSGMGEDLSKVHSGAALQVKGAQEYRLDLGLEGRAYVDVLVYYYGENGRFLAKEALGNTVVVKGNVTTVPFRLVVPESATAARIAINHEGRSFVRVEFATLSLILPPS